MSSQTASNRQAQSVYTLWAFAVAWWTGNRKTEPHVNFGALATKERGESGEKAWGAFARD